MSKLSRLDVIRPSRTSAGQTGLHSTPPVPHSPPHTHTHAGIQKACSHIWIYICSSVLRPHFVTFLDTGIKMCLVEHGQRGPSRSSNVFLMYALSLLRPEMEVERTVRTRHESVFEEFGSKMDLLIQKSCFFISQTAVA